MAAAAIVNLFAHGPAAVTAISALCASVALTNLFYVQRNVVQPLLKLRSAAFRIASGDTRTRVVDEGVLCTGAVAKALEQVRVKLDGVLKDNMLAAGKVRDGVDEVVAANANLSMRTSEHAAGLEETVASLEQITATVARNTESARQAAQLAVQSSTATARGREVVSEVSATMGAITESSKRIGEIVGIIDGIAFQTNLLALNAAVEAARAGEQGRGFAVVAQEVRSLAQRSAASAKEIKELIELSTHTVTRGSQLATQAEESMAQVVASVKRVTDVIAEIEVASREQAAGIEQINRAMSQMDKITQQDAEMAQELSETAQGLQRQSEQMLAAISAFSMQAAGTPPIAAAAQESRSFARDA